jgi:hypothetical protein
MPARIKPELEREVLRLAAEGHGLRAHRASHQVLKAFGGERTRAGRVAATELLLRRLGRLPAGLSVAEKEEIPVGLAVSARGDLTAIAAGLGRAVSTVSRELATNGGRKDYPGWRAHSALATSEGIAAAPSGPARPSRRPPRQAGQAHAGHSGRLRQPFAK